MRYTVKRHLLSSFSNLGCRSKKPAVKCHCGQMSLGQTSLAGKGPAGKCHLKSTFSNLGCRSKIPWSNVTAVKCPAVKRHWRSKVPRSNVTCGQVFLILVAGQKSRGQMSLRSNVPRSNVTGGQMSRGQMSLAVKCPAVKCHLRSNVPRSNVTCGQMSPRSNVSWSNVTAVKCPAVKLHLR